MTTEDPNPNGEAVKPAPPPKPRIAALAAILSWLVPGLGHIYAGDRRRGIMIFLFIVGAIIIGLIISGGLAVDIAFHEIAFAGQLGAGGPTLGTVGLKYLRDKRKLGRTGVRDLTYKKLKEEREVVMKEAYDKRGHINPWHELGLLLTTIAGLLNLLVILDAAETAASPNRPKDKSTEESSK